MICCKKCMSEKYVKSGHIRGLQRYQCKDCGCQFTKTKNRGVHRALRQLGIVLYAHAGVSMRGISKIFKISTQAVAQWVKTASNNIPKESISSKAISKVVQIDEMWHFVNGKKTKFGFGERFVGYHVDLLDGTSVIVLTKV